MTPFWMTTDDPALRAYWRKVLTEKRWRVEEGPDKHGGFAFECFDTLEEACRWGADHMPGITYFKVIDTDAELRGAPA